MSETAKMLKLWGPAVAAIKADPVYQTSDSQGLAQVYDALLASDKVLSGILEAAHRYGTQSNAVAMAVGAAANLAASEPPAEEGT